MRHDQVRLLGYIKHHDILNHLALLDVGLYPRPIDFDGRHSIKLLEYMAVGIPIIATDVTESFHVKAANCGLIAAEPNTFANHILLLWSERNYCMRLGNAGKRYVISYDWDVLAKHYEEVVLANCSLTLCKR